jgi:hypothetical protein
MSLEDRKHSIQDTHLQPNKVQSISQSSQEADVDYDIQFERSKEERHCCVPWEELVGEHECSPKYGRYALCIRMQASTTAKRAVGIIVAYNNVDGDIDLNDVSNDSVRMARVTHVINAANVPC